MSDVDNLNKHILGTVYLMYDNTGYMDCYHKIAFSRYGHHGSFLLWEHYACISFPQLFPLKQFTYAIFRALKIVFKAF